MSRIGDIVAKRFPNGLMVGIYNPIPDDWLSTKRKGPLRFIRAWDMIDHSALAQLPELSYTAILMARIMPYPQIEPPREKPL